MTPVHDPLIGTWTLSPSRSQFDPNHCPRAATLTIERASDGSYVLKADGVGATGKTVSEKPQTLTPDGQARPVPEFPGLSLTATRPDANTLTSDLRREDGSVAGQGTYAVSEDGRSLTAVTKGFDSQLRPFEQRTSWDKVNS